MRSKIALFKAVELFSIHSTSCSIDSFISSELLKENASSSFKAVRTSSKLLVLLYAPTEIFFPSTFCSLTRGTYAIGKSTLTVLFSRNCYFPIKSALFKGLLEASEWYSFWTFFGLLPTLSLVWWLSVMYFSGLCSALTKGKSGILNLSMSLLSISIYIFYISSFLNSDSFRCFS